MHIKVKRGLDIPIEGAPTGEVKTLERPRQVALDLSLFHDIKFKVLVKPGDQVKLGQPLAFDKRHEERQFVSPGGGTISEVRRGLKRRLLSIVIDLADQEEVHQHSGTPTSRDEILARLLEGGIFAHIRMRPFGFLADPTHLPRNIFVKAVESAPFVPPAELQVAGHEEAFQAGLTALSKLTDGTLHLVHREGSPCRAFTEARDVQIHTVEGPHPSANASLHIQKIDPMQGAEDRVWTIDARDVVTLGHLLQTGRYNTDRIIALAGEGIKPEHRGFYSGRAGYPLAPLISGRLAPGEQRLISGDPLMGDRAEIEDFLGIRHMTATVLPDAPGRQMFHFLRLGGKFTAHRTYFSSKTKPAHFTTALRGEERAFIDAAIYDKVMPMRIPTVQLVKAVIADDWDQAEVLGIYDVVPEDFALATFICPSKVEMVGIMRDGLHRFSSEILV
jgi:Na+-transporting NADH:ubiquinone oxidoreductase subunit A